MALQPRLDRTIDDMVVDSHAGIDDAIDRWQPEGVFAAFSGGNDSTVMLDVVRDRIDGVLHVDTTIGVRQTREFVEQVAADWRLPLQVVRPSRTFASFVRENGFFGPRGHQTAYRVLKKDALREFKRQMLEPYKSTRIMLLSGVRAGESHKRMKYGAAHDVLEERIVWVSPIRDWTSDDMRAYRERHPNLPRNPVNDALGKSGECLCGCFSVGPVELPIIRDLDPETADEIEALQVELERQGSPYCRWGPGGEASGRPAGPLCAGCDEVPLFEPDWSGGERE